MMGFAYSFTFELGTPWSLIHQKSVVASVHVRFIVASFLGIADNLRVLGMCHRDVKQLGHDRIHCLRQRRAVSISSGKRG